MSQKMVYKFREGSRLSGDAEKVGKRIEKLASYTGRVTPPDVVKDAQRKNSPLHPYFTWDDSAAAEQYRLGEARRLIASIEVVKIDNGTPVRAFHSVRVATMNEDEPDRGYVTLDRASREMELRQQIVRRLYAQARSLMREAKAFEAFAGVIEAIEALPPREEVEKEVAA